MIENSISRDRDKIIASIHKIDHHLCKFVEEILPGKFLSEAISALKIESPELYQKCQKCEHFADVAMKANTDVPISTKKDLWEVVHKLYQTYTCAKGFTKDKSIRKFVTIYIKGDKPKKAWPSNLVKLQDKLVNKLDSKRMWTFSFDSRIFTAELNQEEIDRLRRDDNVSSIVEEQEVHINWGDYAPQPPFQAEIENVDWGTSRINPTYAWNKGIKGQGVKVCVVDTGVDYTHIDLVDRYKGGWNFVGGNADPMDDHMHGTHCAGIVLGSDNGVGYKGVAPEADLYACKILSSKGSGSLSILAAGIDWCTVNGMDIISMSVGGAGTCSGVLLDVCNNAWNNGLMIIASAGNDGLDCSEEVGCVGQPANASSVVAVGSIDIDEYRSLFSSYGPQVEITAPGEGITSAWLVNHDLYGDGTHIIGDSWYYASGTSMSCPQVAGACALIKCWYPAATNYQIREWLRDNARDL